MASTAKLTAVLLPGIDGTGKMFQPLLDQIPATLNTCVIDYPVDKFLTYSELVSVVRQRLPDSPYIIIAESFAGPLALQLCLSNDSNLKALVLCATFVRNPRPLLSSVLKPLMHEAILSVRPHPWMARLFVMGWDVPDELMNKALGLHETIPARVMLKRLQEVFSVDARARLVNCSKPILHLYAEHDRLILQMPSKEIRKLRPDIPSHGIEGPHFLLQRRPLECWRIISGFLRQQNIL